MNEELKRANEQAKAQLDSITEMVAALDTEDEDNLEQARQTIYEDPLSINVRSDWHPVGSAELDLSEFMILLCTGGPAARIIGKLGQHSEPISVTLQYQDWFTPWVDYACSSDESETLIQYAREFWYGT